MNALLEKTLDLNNFTLDLSKYNEDDVIGIEVFKDLLNEAVRVASERNVPLYCGEFGVINLASPEDSLKWFKMI